MQIHELNNFTGTPDDGDYLAIDNGNETTKISVKEFIPDTTPVGTITMFGGSTAPIKWVLCDGRAISRTDYADLFQIIGTTYGSGNGSTTFNVPDMRNRFVVGAGSNYNLNSKGGANTVTLSTDEIPAHTHGSKSLTGYVTLRKTGAGYNTAISRSGIVSSITSSGSGSTSINGSGSSGQTLDQVNIDASHEHNSVGGGEAHENRPPYIGINFIIFAGV